MKADEVKATNGVLDCAYLERDTHPVDCHCIFCQSVDAYRAAGSPVVPDVPSAVVRLAAEMAFRTELKQWIGDNSWAEESPEEMAVIGYSELLAYIEHREDLDAVEFVRRTFEGCAPFIDDGDYILVKVKP